MSGVAKRLQDGRSELLSELALLGPMFQGGTTQAASNGRVEKSAPAEVATKPERQSQQSLSLPEAPLLKSLAINENAFVDTRLWPCLANRGCGLGSRDAEFFRKIESSRCRRASGYDDGYSSIYRLEHDLGRYPAARENELVGQSLF